MNTNVMSNINFFFLNPSTPPVPPRSFSQLYLLRRDISDCFGIDPTSKKPHPSFQALWPGVMAICAGIDLLGKFLSGDDSIGTVGPRFKKFLIDCSGIPPIDADIIYHLRNSLLHSFGLYSEDVDRKCNVIRIYKFILYRGGGTLINTLGNDTYRMDIDIFWKEFENATTKYESQLRTDATLQINFSKMFPKHQGVYIS